MDKNNHYLFKVWEVLYPFVVYYAMNLFGMYAALLALGYSAENYMAAEIFGAIVTIPLLYMKFYMPDRAFLEKDKLLTRQTAINSIWILAIALFIGVGLNNIISMSPLVELSDGYKAANKNFYSSTLPLELLGSGLLVPFLEELICRGIIFYRIKRSTGRKWRAVVISALMFSILHTNIVQFIFAFLMGLVLAIFMDKTEYIYGPIIAHMAVNIFGVLRTEFGLLGQTADKSPMAWAFSIIITIAGVVLLVVYNRNNSDTI